MSRDIDSISIRGTDLDNTVPRYLTERAISACPWSLFWTLQFEDRSQRDEHTAYPVSPQPALFLYSVSHTSTSIKVNGALAEESSVKKLEAGFWGRTRRQSMA